MKFGRAGVGSSSFWLLLSAAQQHGGKRLVEIDPEFDDALTRQSDALAELLERRGVKVHRPEPLDAEVIAACPGGFYSY